MEQRKLQEMKSDLSPEGFAKNPMRAALIERWNKWIPQKDQFGRPMAMDAYKKYCLAQLFENQLAEVKTFKEKHILGEDTTTANTAPFIKYTFPLLRRVWPSLIAPEIVSVQPMSQPVGAVFYFELKYGDSKGSVNAGDKLIKDMKPTYSSVYVDNQLIATGNGSMTEITHTLAWTPVVPGKLKIVAGGVTAIDDGQGALTGAGVASGVINYATGEVVLTLAAAPANGVQIKATYEYNSEGSAKIPSVNVDIALVSVQAKSRKLKALWSSEAADDLKALHGIDAEQELVAGVGSELALEIDREIIEDIKLGATGALASYNMAVPSGVKELDHIRGVFTPMTLIANQIGKNLLRGPANWVVMSYDFAAHIEQLYTDGFFRPIFAGDAEAMAKAEPQSFGITKMGTLASRYTSYKDPYLQSNKVIMGYKGSSFVDAAYVWAPYIPMQITNAFLDPNDFKFRKGLRTRYAKLMARSEGFGVLTLSNLNGLSAGSFGAGTTLY